MRLTDKQKEQVLASGVETRPGGSLIRKDGQWVVVWHINYDDLVDPYRKVPPASRWRAQVVTGVDASGVWFYPEGLGKTRSQAIANALAI
jgi:hypothetical protein